MLFIGKEEDLKISGGDGHCRECPRRKLLIAKEGSLSISKSTAVGKACQFQCSIG